MKNNFLLILEIVWIVAGTLCIIIAIKLALSGGPRILMFILMALVAYLFAWIRHSQRKKL